MTNSSPSQTQNNDALSKITKDRTRTNILKTSEQQLIAFLVQRIPPWVSPNMLTGFGLGGSLVTAGSFSLAAHIHRMWLLLGVFGFFLNWFGDSLDGRLAYFRNRPRKWYGFSLDFMVDWLTNILIGYGYIVYVGGQWGLIGFLFVILYGGEMMMALLRYKIVDRYTIDSGILGPTEARIFLCLIIILEVIVKDSIIYTSAISCLVLLILNINDFRRLLKMSDQRDKDEKAQQAAKQ
jgi:phosphatidylglycerophosphate synthase